MDKKKVFGERMQIFHAKKVQQCSGEYDKISDFDYLMY